MQVGQRVNLAKLLGGLESSRSRFLQAFAGVELTTAEMELVFKSWETGYLACNNALMAGVRKGTFRLTYIDEAGGEWNIS